MLRKDWLLIALIVCILSLMIIPLSPALIDILLTLNITLSIVLLMVGIYVRNPSDFSTFPSVILIGTAFRLALSIGTTRLILTEAEGGDIIETFGSFVVGGSIAIGLVIFLIITVVQFLVVTKGAERVAEVAARFALDALPGKQMAIDADIKVGTVTATEGDRLRRLLNKESQFFGAMDGAMKFVKGDAIAGLIIIVINLIGGMIVGVAMHGMTFAESGHLFTLLTVGDGLVAQIPALLMALCAGVVVTRATGPENTDLGSDISRELLADHRVPAVASVLVFAMGLVPGFPILTFSCAALLLASIAAVQVARKRRARAEAAEDPKAVPPEPSAAEQAAPVNDRFVVWLGEELAARLDPAALQQLLEQQFERLCDRTGVVFACPGVKVAADLPPAALRITLDDVPLVTASIPRDHVFVGHSEKRCREAGLDQATALGLGGWVGCRVPATAADRIGAAGFASLDLTTMLAMAVFRIFERNIAELFGRKEFDVLVATLTEADGTAMAAVLQAAGPSNLFRVFRALVSDGVPLRPASLLVEALNYWTQMPEVIGPQLLEDCLRGSLKRQLCHALADNDGVLGIVLMDPDYEAWLRKLATDTRKGTAGDSLALPAEWAEPVLQQFRGLFETRTVEGRTVAIVVAADLRRRLRNFLASNDIQVPVLAPHELGGETRSFPLEVLNRPQPSDSGDAAFRDARAA
jgi:type III secretion protein V